MARDWSLRQNVKPRLAREAKMDGPEDNMSLHSHSGDDHESEGFDSAEDRSDGSHRAGFPAEDSSGVSAEQSIRTVSFGSLVQAQDALSRKRKRGVGAASGQEDKLSQLRARLRQIRSAEGTKVEEEKMSSRGRVRSRLAEDSRDEINDNSSAPSEEDVSLPSRQSKHAPSAQSSKHQVTRKRTVIDVPKRSLRDPRFDAFHQNPSDLGNAEKAYDFLWDYRQAEMAELKNAIKATKDDNDRQKLRRKLNSMENRVKSKVAKEREQEIVRNHRKDERQRVKEGKAPFYLKRKEVKDRALVEKFRGMKGKEREKLLERRRLKDSQKEKRNMPQARRTAG